MQFLFKSPTNVGWNKCVLKRWGEAGEPPGLGTTHRGGMTVEVCRNLMAHEGCRDCWFRLRCTLDDRWKCARKQTRHCTRLGKQHARSPSASTDSPLAPHVRTDNGRRWKARLIEMIIDRWVPSMRKTKAESRFFFFFFSIRTHFHFLLGLDLPGRRAMWKKRYSAIALCVCARLLWCDISLQRHPRVPLLPRWLLSLLFTQQ